MGVMSSVKVWLKETMLFQNICSEAQDYMVQNLAKTRVGTKKKIYALRPNAAYLNNYLLHSTCSRIVILVDWFCCFSSQVNSYGHCGTVSLPNHTFPGQA